MSSFSVLGAPSKQIFEQVEPVPGFWEFPAEAWQRAWQAAAGNGRTVVSGGRQWEKEGGDVHTELDLKCWQVLRLAGSPEPQVWARLGLGGSRAGGERTVLYRKDFRSRWRQQRALGALELDGSEGWTGSTGAGGGDLGRDERIGLLGLCVGFGKCGKL